MKDETEINRARTEADQSRIRLEQAFDTLKDSVKLSAQLAETAARRTIESRRDQVLGAIQVLEKNRPLAMLAVYAGGFVLGVLLSEKVRAGLKKKEMIDESLAHLREA